MSALKTAIAVLWVVFGIYWIVSAFGAKRGSRTGRLRAPGLIFIVAFLLLRLFGAKSLAVHSLVLEVIGTILLVSGFALAVWARIYLGRNWGMPMTQKEEPELVTSGPTS
jgi:protein-S-isoprenylcysteine O-methyltransferase Ste14